MYQLLKIYIYFFNKTMYYKHMQTIGNAILSRIYGHGRGWVFTPGSFTDITEKKTASVALGRLVEKGEIRRLSRGLYDYPRTHPKLGVLYPDINSVVKAIVGRDKIRLQPAGAYAANVLGLSEQVPAKIVFLTDGKNQKVSIGKMIIEFKHTSTKKIALAGKEAGLVIEALRYLKERNISKSMIKKLSGKLSTSTKTELMKNIRLAPDWMVPFLKEAVSPR